LPDCDSNYNPRTLHPRLRPTAPPLLAGALPGTTNTAAASPDRRPARQARRQPVAKASETILHQNESGDDHSLFASTLTEHKYFHHNWPTESPSKTSRCPDALRRQLRRGSSCPVRRKERSQRARRQLNGNQLLPQLMLPDRYQRSFSLRRAVASNSDNSSERDCLSAPPNALRAR